MSGNSDKEVPEDHSDEHTQERVESDDLAAKQAGDSRHHKREKTARSSRSNGAQKARMPQRPLSDYFNTSAERQTQIDSEKKSAELCPECLVKGIRRGKVQRGGQKVQRYLCACHGYYHDPDLVEDREKRIRSKINDYLFAGGSQKYRAREVSKSRQVFARRLRRLRRECLDDLGIVREFKPDWGENSRNGGVIVFDATTIEGSPYLVYIAVDEKTNDVVAYRKGGKEENEEDWLAFFRHFDRTGYEIKLIVSDKGRVRCLINAVARHYPNKPHQIDWEHEMREILEIMPLPPRTLEEARRRRRHDYQNDEEQELYALIVRMRHAPKEAKENENDKEDAFDELWKTILAMYATTTKRGRDVIELLQQDLRWLKAHYAAHRDITSSNSSEYMIARLKGVFLRARRGIHATSPYDFTKAMNLVWAVFRARPMYDSEVPAKRNKATLELARTKIKVNDIWQFVKRRKKRQNT
jgi:hypothetical protein